MNRREALRRAALMLGVTAISPTILSGVLHAQAATGANAGAKPRTSVLTAAQLATTAALAERIMPRTDTPGAIDVGVPAFIDLMLADYVTADERRGFLAGLADVEARSNARHQRPFTALSPEQQDALIREVATASKDKGFFHQMRELAVVGYFTAEEVGKKVTHYDPVPGRYDACVPISEVGNVVWTK